MKTKKITVLLLAVLSGAICLYAAVPGKRAVVTAIATSSCGCGEIASTRVDGDYTNSALVAMGISSVHMTGPEIHNEDLRKNPPHKGEGKGIATVTQTGVCEVITDSTGKVKLYPTYTPDKNTIPCEPGD